MEDIPTPPPPLRNDAAKNPVISPKATMLSPYRCHRGGISLVSGLRSECSSSSIGPSRAVCSLHTMAYQQRVCACCCPDDCPCPMGGGHEGCEHGLGNAARTGHIHVYRAVCSIASHVPLVGRMKSA